jgi:predicted nucleic acid-binding protein
VNVVVPDASVILKWVLRDEDEEHQPQAAAIVDAALDGRVQIALPALWYFEVGNILVRRVPEHADATLGYLQALLGPWIAAPSPEWQAAIVDVAKKHGASFYDASYHALALVRGGVMITADARYMRKVGDGPHLMALSDWPPR